MSSNQISPSSSAGSAGQPPPFPSLFLSPRSPSLWAALSLPPSLALDHSLALSLCVSLHPLSERQAEAVGSLRRVWGSARAVRGCYLGLLQQTGSSSPKGRGRVESESHSAQHSLAQDSTPQDRTRQDSTGQDSYSHSQAGTSSAFQLRGERGKLKRRQERTAERQRERDRRGEQRKVTGGSRSS